MRAEKLAELEMAIDKFKIINDEVLTDEQPSYLQIEVHGITLANGRWRKREKIIKGKGNSSASVIIPVTEEGNVILTIQPKSFIDSTVGVNFKVGVDFPGGLVDVGEDFATAALRELQEETGYYSDNIIELDSYYTEENIGGSYVKGFLALNCKKVGEPKLEPDEDIIYIEVTIEELFELKEMGYILGGGSKCLLLTAKPYLDEILKTKSNIDDDVRNQVR